MKFEELTGTAIAELQRVFEKMRAEDVQPAVDALIHAKRVFCYGGGREGLGLRFFVMRLMHLGKEAHWAWDDTSPSCGKGDVFMVTGGSGAINHVGYSARLAKEAGATLIAVTAVPDSPLGRMADIIVRLPAQAYLAEGADVVRTTQPMGNLYEQAAVVLYDTMSIMMRDQMGQTEADMEHRHRNYE